MGEIRCPHCGQAFTVDESGYADLVRQVHDREFKRELAERLEVEHRAAAEREKIAVARAEGLLREQLAESRALIEKLTVQLESQASQAQMQSELAAARASEAVKDELRAAERARDELAAQIERDRADMERLKQAHQSELAVQLRAKDEAIALRDREIEGIRRMRAELSTKMVGESLERFCETEFDKLRATGFQRARFGKDNEVVDGSKGDYVYREIDEDGIEVVSIMFEMKNEADDSAHRKRNEDHFKKLDQDRRNKGCEYAVLVSLLERDSEYYNTGIVDVSYQSGYEKMYVIRPQFFIPMITLIRNASMKSLAYRRELARVRQQNIDVSNFEDQLDSMKEKFGRNVDIARRKFQAAIDDIDATIKKLEKIKAELTSSDRNIDLANRKLEDITVKKLTRGNPTMKAKFEEAAAARASAEDE
ncbi:hypothetical protein JI75_05135 [Berryella intestinalis]|uniref:DUF2130 domain-containing protein n=1 Tax=Berryella intestinalis TaxID=1531429 RepID=A0A0A8B5S4_9ACTN|nr:DUF2130 domain-containing protein [Berryella intestinalis]AJC12143.1 hypothetical protein JI75_05135 [Berryella intestinalis]